MRKLLKLSYDGTGYSGWQIQSGGEPTIQGDLEACLSKLYGGSIELVGCGRTDAGVHARGYYAHMDCDDKWTNADLRYKLNKMLGTQIVIEDVMDVSDAFHARFDARSRSYCYRMRLDNDPFDNRFTFTYPYNDTMDLKVLNEAALIIGSYRDFNTFCKTKTDVKTKLCTIQRSLWTYDAETQVYKYEVTADRFLRGMIRLIVGACLLINRGQLTLEELDTALSHKTRLPKDWSVAACGLTLLDITY